MTTVAYWRSLVYVSASRASGLKFGSPLLLLLSFMCLLVKYCYKAIVQKTKKICSLDVRRNKETVDRRNLASLLDFYRIHFSVAEKRNFGKLAKFLCKYA